jgi:flagellar hook-associated protein 2
MGSPITLSGFNNIDFGSVLNALMQQERIPVTQLESQQTALKAQQTAFSTFATKLASLESAAEDLTRATSFQGRSTSVSNTSALTASAGTLTPIGSYEIFVNELARAQVTGTNSTHADKDTTIVASGGTLVIGGTTVTISGNVTLQGLADAINGTAGIEATASVVQNNGNFQLVLTGNETGAANAFTITDNLTGGTADVNFDLTTGQPASDASGTVNGIAFTSTTNVVDGAVPGATLTLTKKDPLNAVVLTITGDSSSVKGLVQKFTDAYNDIVKFIDDQQAAAGRKETNNIGRDPLIRGLRTQLSRTLLQEFGTGDFNALSQVGLSFNRTGQLQFNSSEFDTALSADPAKVQALFRGDGTANNTGIFGAFADVVESYTKADGLVPNAKERLGDLVTKNADRIAEMERRLEIRRQQLQKEFAAADLAISQLNQQGSSLSQLNSGYRLF